VIWDRHGDVYIEKSYLFTGENTWNDGEEGKTTKIIKHMSVEVREL
jgi:hypothetical protein